MKLHTFTSKAILCGKTCNEFPVLVRITAAPWRHTEEMPRAGVDIVVVVDINMGRVSHCKLKIIKQALMTVIDKLGPNDRFSIVWFKGSVPHTMKLTFTSNKGKEIAKVMINELDGSHGNNTIAALQEGVEVHISSCFPIETWHPIFIKAKFYFQILLFWNLLSITFCAD